MTNNDAHLPHCKHCASRSSDGFNVQFSMAFQPIYDATDGSIFAHEALVRTTNGGSAASVLCNVDSDNLYNFDKKCRVEAIKLAAELELNTLLSINCMPNAIIDPLTCLRTTLLAARHYNFPVENIIFEFVESEEIAQMQHIKNVIDTYKSQGFRTALDDFGSGHANLNVLCELQPDVVKLDMSLIRGIDQNARRRQIVQSVLLLCMDLDSNVVIEGVETVEEFDCLVGLGARLFQGFLFNRPKFESLAQDSILPLPRAA